MPGFCMPRRDDLWLADIVESGRRVAKWLTGVTNERWDDDEVLQSAVAYQIQAIGEAASALSDEVKAQMPDVPWRSIRGFRNIIVHQYFAVDWTTVRDTAEVAVPHLVSQVVAFLQEHDAGVLDRLNWSD